MLAMYCKPFPADDSVSYKHANNYLKSSLILLCSETLAMKWEMRNKEYFVLLQTK